MEKQQDFRKVFFAQVRCSRLLQLREYDPVSFYFKHIWKKLDFTESQWSNASRKFKAVDAMVVKEIKPVRRPKSNWYFKVSSVKFVVTRHLKHIFNKNYEIIFKNIMVLRLYTLIF